MAKSPSGLLASEAGLNMEHKCVALPDAKPGWRLEGHLRKVDGRWVRLRVDATGPIHTDKSGARRQWREAFGGVDCEGRARRYMQEHYGEDPFSPRSSAGVRFPHPAKAW